MYPVLYVLGLLQHKPAQQTLEHVQSGCIVFKHPLSFNQNGVYTIISENEFGSVNKSIKVLIINSLPGKLITQTFMYYNTIYVHVWTVAELCAYWMPAFWH